MSPKFTEVPLLEERRSLKKKNQGFNGIQTRDLRDTGAMLLQLSLNWKIYCDDHSSLSSTTAAQI